MFNTADDITISVSEEKINKLDELLSNIDAEMAVSMSCARRAQGMSIAELQQRLEGLNASTLRRYMQQSYRSMRPIHVVAALSWIMMVPMTSFYHAVKLREHYRGMDDKGIEALFCIGRLPEQQFELYLDLITSLMSSTTRNEFERFRQKTTALVDPEIRYDDLFAPKTLDMNAFAIDYYRSIAITVKRFRHTHQISINTMARVLGLPEKQYIQLEDVYKVRDYSVAIGFRVKLGFNLNSHVNFTSEMRQFQQFHQLRQVQHVRDSLMIEALRNLDGERKIRAVEILTPLSKIYARNVTH
ncbi:hypothetical protein [Vibrio bivalvicida]|uniref:XRE family transcriptional regulator n=1 Tax=Vibrio bivalvicida TaxID=1276888 RepID=A0ABV4MKI0_9VIBR